MHCRLLARSLFAPYFAGWVCRSQWLTGARHGTLLAPQVDWRKPTRSMLEVIQPQTLLLRMPKPRELIALVAQRRQVVEMLTAKTSLAKHVRQDPAWGGLQDPENRRR
jgi:hypothetical protein